MIISYSDFEKVDIRLGKIIEAHDFPEARKPAYILKIDFGPEIGMKKSSAQLPAIYSKDEIIGKLVMAVVNFEPKQIGPHKSEVLVLGFPDKNGHPVLMTPDNKQPIIGSKLF